MKKILFIPILCTTLYASDPSEKTTLTHSDKSMEKSKRKSILGFSHLGLEAKSSTLPVIFCNHRGACLPIGKKSITLNQNRVNAILNHQYPFLISQRYDKVIMKHDGIEIITPTQEFHDQLNSMNPYSFNTGSKEQFKSSVLEYLNTSVAQKFTQVLDMSKEDRFKHMQDSEVELFINTQAKELGITSEMLDVLMASSFAYALYLPRIEGSVVTYQHKKGGRNGNRIFYDYSTEVKAPANTELLIYKFDGEKFTYYKTIDSKAKGFGNTLAKGASGSQSIYSPVRPHINDTQKLFDQLFYTSFKDTLIAINKRLKEDRMFALQAPIDEVNKNNISSALGVQEDIKVGAPFKVMQSDMEGKEHEMGWVRFKDIGTNCLNLPPQERENSTAKLIKGQAEEFDMLVEHPYTGVFFGLSGEHQARSFDLSSTLGYGSYGSTNYINLNFDADMGFLSNTSGMYNVWAQTLIGFGQNSGEGTIHDGYALQVASSMEKRFDLFKGLFLGLGAQIGLELGSNNSTALGTTQSTIVTLKPLGKLGYNFSPNSYLYLGAGYDFTIYSEYNSAGYYSYSSSSKDDMSLMMGLSFQVDFAGPFAKLTAAPSSKCR